MEEFTGLTITTKDVAGHDLDDVAAVVELFAAARPGTRVQVSLGFADITIEQPTADDQFTHAQRAATGGRGAATPGGQLR